MPARLTPTEQMGVFAAALLDVVSGEASAVPHTRASGMTSGQDFETMLRVQEGLLEERGEQKKIAGGLVAGRRCLQLFFFRFRFSSAAARFFARGCPMLDRSGTAVLFPLPIVTVQKSTVRLILEAGTWMKTERQWTGKLLCWRRSTWILWVLRAWRYCWRGINY